VRRKAARRRPRARPDTRVLAGQVRWGSGWALICDPAVSLSALLAVRLGEAFHDHPGQLVGQVPVRVQVGVEDGDLSADGEVAGGKRPQQGDQLLAGEAVGGPGCRPRA